MILIKKLLVTFNYFNFKNSWKFDILSYYHIKRGIVARANDNSW
jgi:hypothetical protein